MTKETRNLLIFGSRDIMYLEAQDYIRWFVEEYKPTAILTAAEPGGVCEIARDLAQETTIPLKVFYKQAHRASGQYHWRSVMAIKDADFTLFVWDGTSKGTANEIKVAEKLGAKKHIEIICPTWARQGKLI